MKQINFEFDGVNYCLEYTKGSVRKMGEDGFVLTKITENPMILEDLFAGAFIAHHRHTPKETIKTIFENMPNREKLYSALTEMYLEPINELYDEPKESKKNIKWESNFKSSLTEA